MENYNLPIVFLDVDGILTYHNYNNNKTEHIDLNKVDLLKNICDKTEASVVIISSWRGTADWTPSIYNTLRQILKNAEISVLGDAPYIECELEDYKPSYKPSGSIEDVAHSGRLRHGTGRAAEVQRYLTEHPTTHFVILDDDDWNWNEYGLAEHWVRPSWFIEGLTPKHVEMAIKILNN